MTLEEELGEVAARAVGQLGLLRARELVRASMVAEALRLAGGNRTRAGQLLGVSRQALQYVQGGGAAASGHPDQPDAAAPDCGAV